MIAHRLVPILNVSNIGKSFAWFERLGWKKGWDWGDPPSFGAVCSGACEIFLCEKAQGGHGRSEVPMTFGPSGDTTGDKGVWISIWVDDVDAVHKHCITGGSRWRGLRPTCRGVSVRCTCATLTGMSSE